MVAAELVQMEIIAMTFDADQQHPNICVPPLIRRQVVQKFVSGKWGVDLETYEADQARDLRRCQEISS